MGTYSNIHIISSGENNHNTINQAINEYKMDKVIIVVDKLVFEKPELNEHYPKIIKSIKKVKKRIESIGKKFELKHIDSISLNTVRDAVLDIVNEKDNKGATLYFNVSGGTKVLSNGLFMMAIWLDGIVYFVGEDKMLQELTIPKVQSEEIRKNENYITILDLLSKSNNHKILRKVLIKDMGPLYKPIRMKGKPAKRELVQGTLTKWAEELEAWKLIKIGHVEGKRKDKEYTLTDDGLFTLKFIRATSP